MSAPIKPSFVIDGVPFWWGGEQRKKVIQEALDFEFDPTDILVAGYPRSGTTFRKQLVWLVAHGCDVERAKAEAVWVRVPMLDRDENEQGDMTTQEQLAANTDKPRIIFTHLPYRMLQKKAEAAGIKVIYLYRNPKDILVSHYHVSQFFLPMIGDQYKDISFAQCVQLMSGEFDRLNVVDHVLEYWKHKNNPRFLLMSYEEHRKDYAAIIHRVAKFLGKEITEEQEKRAVDFLSFDKFKDHMNKEMAGSRLVREDVKDTFVKKGEVGEWKQYFTVAQSEYFDHVINKRLEGSDLTFQYE